MTEEVREPSTLCVCSAEMKESSSGGFDFDLEELTSFFLRSPFPPRSMEILDGSQHLLSILLCSSFSEELF